MLRRRRAIHHIPALMKKKYTTVVILITIAGILAIINYQKSIPAGERNRSVTSPAPSPNQNATPPSFVKRPLPSGLTDEERDLFNVPAPNAPIEEKDRHFELALKLAKESEYLDLNNCEKPSPLVLKVIGDREIKIRNNSPKEHKISIGRENVYTLPKNSTTPVQPKFSYPTGIYGYACDGVIVGFVVNLPQEE